MILVLITVLVSRFFHIVINRLQGFLLGIGSYISWFEKGWHRPMRFSPNQVPFMMPHSMIASIIYCEQVGRYLQLGGSSGEIINL